MVIHSAWDLARHLVGAGDGPAPAPSDAERAATTPWGSARVPVVGALLVLADASLIEPIAVRAHLWTWSEPGLFAVPPIGVLGWALLAGLAMAVLERPPGGRGPGRLAGLVPIAAGGVHLGLLAAWLGALRWVNGALAPWPMVGVALALAAALTVLAWRRGRGRVPFAELALRVPAAAFFFALLGVTGAEPSLVAWAAAFAPPYLALSLVNRA